ncbi:MAG: N-acetylmuramoyl-L-alanine amidase [Treponema sp.]|jgi:N-acetylmuramoyl-L-alanine amidase|nr:N-acetylmuramoyl-L-alanine amidase [Treponema sp.]
MRKTRCSLFYLFLIFSFLLPVFRPYSLSLDETLNALNPLTLKYSPQFRWDPLFQDGIFDMGGHAGAFYAASREGETGFLLFDGRELFQVPLPYRKNDGLVFPDAFVAALKDAFSRSFQSDSTRFRIDAIVIDAGHGGKDSGAIGKPAVNGKTMQVVEKDIVLKAALELRNLLRLAYPDKRILMTRETDVFYSLEYRADMANAVTVKENEAVIFVAIHANYNGNAGARGYEVWHLNSGYKRPLLNSSEHNYPESLTPILNAMLEEEYTSESIILANSILSSLKEALGDQIPSRGRKANDWFVVRNSRMPAVLVELGFVSNPKDAVLMTSADGLRKLTEALYKGLVDYVSIFENQGTRSAMP